MRARHELLLGAIGTFPEEDDAYWLVTTFSWALPLTIFIAALVDVGFVFVYMYKAHPWIDIFIDKEEKEREKLTKKKGKKEKRLKKKQSKPKSVMKRHIPPDFL